jgi:hypothetical protein
MHTIPHPPRGARSVSVAVALLCLATLTSFAGAAPQSEKQRYQKALAARHAALARLAPAVRKQSRRSPPPAALTRVRSLDQTLSAYEKASPGASDTRTDPTTARAIAELRGIAALKPGARTRLVQLQAQARAAIAHDAQLAQTLAKLGKVKPGPARAALERAASDAATRRHAALQACARLADTIAKRKTPLERIQIHLDSYLKAHPRGTQTLTTRDLSPLFHVLRAIKRRPDPRRLGEVLPLALAAVAAEDAVIEARSRLQQVAAAEVLKATAKDAGRVVLVKTTADRGQQIGKSGLRRVTPTQLGAGDFAEGASLVTIERDEKGEVHVREAVVERKGDKLVVYDEASARSKDAKAPTGKKTQRKTASRKAASSKTSTTSARSTSTGAASSARDYVLAAASSETEVVTTSSDASVVLFDLDALPNMDGLVMAGELTCTEETPEGHADTLFSIYSDCVPIEHEEWEEPECTLQAEQGQVWFGTAPFCSASPNDCGKNGMVYVGSDPCGQSNKCTTGEKVLCAPPGDDDVVTVYLGTAPFCKAKPTDCDDIGMQFVSRSTCEANSENCCSMGQKVKCKTPDGAATPIWLGTAPFCKASPESCTERGWTYVESDKSGDGRKCTTGTKVKCQP